MKIIENYNTPFVLKQSVNKVTADEPQPTGDERLFHPFMRPLGFVCKSQLARVQPDHPTHLDAD